VVAVIGPLGGPAISSFLSQQIIKMVIKKIGRTWKNGQARCWSPIYRKDFFTVIIMNLLFKIVLVIDRLVNVGTMSESCAGWSSLPWILLSVGTLYNDYSG
jgi:hypothetical protein